jgi:hypothetical protein
MSMPDLSQLISEAQDAPAFFTKTSKPGTTITGIISSIAVRQTRDIKTKKPESWDDGAPKQQIVVIVDTTNTETGETESRSIYIRWWGANRKAFAAGIIDSGATTPELGGALTATYKGEGVQADKTLDPPKLYEYSYTAPAE